MAPPGRGRTIEPVIVATKIANSCQDFALMPSGGGKARTISPAATTMPHFAGISHKGGGGCGSGLAVCNVFSCCCDKWLEGCGAVIGSKAARYYYVAGTYSRNLLLKESGCHVMSGKRLVANRVPIEDVAKKT